MKREMFILFAAETVGRARLNGAEFTFPGVVSLPRSRYLFSLDATKSPTKQRSFTRPHIDRYFWYFLVAPGDVFSGEKRCVTTQITAA